MNSPRLSLRWLLRAVLLVTVTFAVSAQDWAKARLEKSPRHLEWITVKHGDREVKCFVAFPEVPAKATTVVVIHEIFGLSDWVRGVTDQLAEAGYIAIAPDLLSGSAPGGGGTAELGSGDAVRKAISALSPAQITKDLDAVIAHVKSLPASNGKVAVAGFCWGGSQTFRHATQSKAIAAGLAFYGTAPESASELAKIECPIHGFYGSNDARVNASLPATEKHMKDSGKKFEPVIYEGAGHGFMRAGEDPEGSQANKAAREKAWQRIRDILGKI